jgi:ABC-type transport system involved in multi-copper enzyme maturation permease subunit
VIAKELRDARWACIAGLLLLALLTYLMGTTDLHGETLLTLKQASDASFTAVAAGHISAGAAALWATFFADTALYLLVGVGGALFGARLIAEELDTGTIFVLLSRPLSRARVLLTKYGVAAGALLALCCLAGALALLIGAVQRLHQPPIGGVVTSVALLWLGALFVLGLTLIYSVLLPNAFAAGALGFFTAYFIVMGPLFHNQNPGLPGGQAWSLVTYWSSLDIYAGVANPFPALVIACIAASVPLPIALWLFRQRAY